MGEWRTYKTSQLIRDGVLEIGDGYRAKNSEMSNVGLPFIRAGDVNGGVNTKGCDLLGFDSVARVGNKRSCIGDIILTTKGTVGRLGFVSASTDEFVYSPQLCFWRSLNLDVIDPRFIYFALQSNELKHQIEWSAGQTDMAPYVSLTDQRTSFSISFPEIEEQRAIASLLGSLDDKIDLNRQMNETLEAMARAIFKDWFVDFGPVRAKAEGRPPYLDPDLWALFSDALDDDDKPVGWEEKRVDDILELVYGKALKASDRVDGPIPVYGSGGITGYHSMALVEGPSIIVGRKGTVGSLYWEDGPFFPIDTVFYVKPKTPLTFCFYLLLTLGLDGMNTDAAVPGLNRNNVYRLPVVWSQNELRTEFDRIMNLLRQKMRKNTEESKTLAQLRDLLLPKLMSGEIRLREAEQMVEQAL